MAALPELNEMLREQAKIIGVIGPIGAGKSTLSELFMKRFNLPAIRETFEANPFLDGFYSDHKRWSFQSQIYFLNAKVKQLSSLDPSKSVILDPCLEMDFIYALTHRKMGWMNQDELDLYRGVASALTEKYQIKKPDLILRLKAPVSVLKARIAIRNRPNEKPLLEDIENYLGNLDAAIDEFVVQDGGGRIITFDVSDDSYTDEEHAGLLELEMQNKLNSL